MKWLKVLAAVMIMSVAVPAAAQLKIGVVDLRQALFTSNAAKSFSEKLKSEFQGQEAKVRKVHDEAQKLKDRLDKDGAMMSDAERNKVASDFQDKVKEFQYLKNKLDTAVDNRKQSFLDGAKPLVDQSLQEIVKERHLDMILPREAVVYALPSMDVTAELIDKLNHKQKGK
ncbi:OmpH family outer membrane protein [Mangrovitalea sediminis]|uniref:OmpH family outer membrane protein n=1 Tax=Mangrovitalea sediminis TaxID=1982043 RepID=UPI000BE5CF1F|nr:OmpH family outer membrane protein [Mangrovitalea sediminis]